MASTESLLYGAFDVTDLQEPTTKSIRIYLASAGTDTLKERDALVARVYPKLREYCRENYGLEFQIVDMRWGQMSSWDDHSRDRELSMKELLQCQKQSVGPSFALFIGQKYGKDRLPLHIAAEHFELIMQALRRHKNRDTRDAPQFEYWYSLDRNAIPPRYSLQKEVQVRRSLRPQTSVEKAIYGERPDVDWTAAKLVLKRLLRRGLEYCVQDGTMEEHDITQYLVSDFEVEIRTGLHGCFGRDPMCQAFVRNIIDLKNYVNHPSASKYMEVVYDEEENKYKLNLEAESRLSQIKDIDMKDWFREGCVSKFAVLWKMDDGISVEHHKEHLVTVCSAFEQRMKESIDAHLDGYLHDRMTNLELEVYQHWILAKGHHQTFIGRGEILSVIRSYVMSNDDKPLVVYGERGVGKSAILAKSAVETHTWFEESVTTIVRFIDNTTSIRHLLYSINTQMAIMLGVDPDTIPTTLSELKTFYSDSLLNFPENQNLVIYLDALQHFSTQADAKNLDWVPARLNANVKIVISLTTDTTEMLDTLQNCLVNDDNNYLEVDHMSDLECLSMLMALLNKEDRTLTHEQQSYLVNNIFASCNQPLYVKLLMLQARKWSDSVNLNSLVFPQDCSEYVESVFRKCEDRHGSQFVSQAFAYLTASRTGLSDSEMEDILSLDDDVMNEVQSQIETSVRRFPLLFWIRLKSELGDFLTQKEHEGVTVYNWTHELFSEVATLMYLKKYKKKEVHSLLGDYYLGLWAGKRKPYKSPTSTNNNEHFEEADRLVPRQPLTFESTDHVTRYNRRKYDQVPRHLLASGRLDELNDLVIFNYQWIYNKTKAISLDHVVTDLALNIGVEASLVEKALRDAQCCITRNINNMAAEISGRLLPYYNSHTNIRKLIQQCDVLGANHSALIPNFSYHEVPGSPLKFTMKTDGPIDDIALVGYDKRYAMTKKKNDPYIRVYDLVTGRIEANIFTSVGRMCVSPNGERTITVDHNTEKTIKIHDTRTGEFLGQLIPLNKIQLKPKEKYKLSDVSVSDSHVCVVATTDKSYLFIADLLTCKFLQVIGLDGRSTICEITRDARFVFCSSNENLLAYDLLTMKNVTNTTLEQRPKKIIFNSDTSRAFVINGVENRLFMLTLSDGGVDFLYKVLLHDSFEDDLIDDIVLSNNEDMLVVRGNNNLLVYEITDEKVQCHFRRPDDIPKGFKLPGSCYMDIHFTNCVFSSDDKFLIASIFRNVYIWNVMTRRLLASLQAPVGLIDHLYVPPDRSQIITQSSKSDIIQVWGIGDAIGNVGMPDRLTTPVEDIIVASDGKTAFVKCVQSDEIGIFDMSSGKLSDLLTHDSPIKDMVATSDGKYVFASLTNAKGGLYNKIWNVTGRKIIYEFGNASAYCTVPRNEDAFYVFCQDENEFKLPYKLTKIVPNDESFTEYKIDHEMNFLLGNPFITPGDKYLVALNADSYHDAVAQYVNPTICAISLGNMSMNTYSVANIQQKMKIKRILHIRPCPENFYTVIILYTHEPDPTRATEKPYNHCYGFMIFDVCSGVICQVIEEFMSPQIPYEGLLFNDDTSLCIDPESNVFDMGTGFFIRELYKTQAQPRLLALHSKVAVYYEDTFIFVVRLLDQKCIGHVDVHADVAKLSLCSDQRTLVVGCRDGSITSYVIVDSSNDKPENVVSAMPTRRVHTDKNGMRTQSRSWDKVDYGPAYSRPPSALQNGMGDREILKKVKPVMRSRQNEDMLVYMSTRSRTCVIQ